MSYYDDMRQMYAQAAQSRKQDKGGWIGPAATALGAAGGFMVGGPGGAVAGAKIGGSLGDMGHNAVNKTLTPENVIEDAAGAYGQYKTMPVNFAGGGVVPGFENASPEMMTLLQAIMAQKQQGAAAQPQPSPEDLLAAEEAQLGAPPVAKPMQTASHPGWEALGLIAGDVMSKLPPPRQTSSSNKTIGAYMPAAGAAVSGLPKVNMARRGAANDQAAEANKVAQESWTTQARDLANRRWALSMKRADVGKPDAIGDLEKPIPDGLRQELKVPKTIATYRDLNEWQDAMTRANAGKASADAKAQTAADEDALAAQMADDIAHFRSEPIVSMSGRSAQFGAKVKNKVNEILKSEKSPYDFNQLTRLSGQQKAFQQNTANSQRFAQLRQSAQTVAQHLNQFEELWGEYEKAIADKKIPLPKNFRPTNQMVFDAANAGILGTKAQDAAVAMGDVTGEALGKEVAVVLRGGFAPFDQDIRDADKMLSRNLGPSANRARLKALRNLLKARIHNAVEATPFAGGKQNPYLLEPSPLEGWDKPPLESFVNGGGQ